jgi:DNA adenine methylase
MPHHVADRALSITAGSLMTLPLLKWAGGKTQLLPEIVARMPKDWNTGTYHEPFMGGGALFFALQPVRAVISDLNADLVMMYEQVRSNLPNVERTLRAFTKAHDRAFYEQIRSEWNSRVMRSMSRPHRRAAMFIYLNKTCFNGLWRVNKSGEFNVPMGSYTDPKIHDGPRLANASRALAGATILCQPYLFAQGIHTGDFVYYDPPYDPLSLTSSFTRYTSDFGRTEQLHLANLAAALVRKGVRVMLSNNNTRFIRDIYKARGFKLHRVQAKRSINANTAKRGSVTELIITGGYRP